jgi:hypothetical protein
VLFVGRLGLWTWWRAPAAVTAADADAAATTTAAVAAAATGAAMGAAGAASAAAAAGLTRGAKRECGSMQQDEEYDGQRDKNRRRRERNTEAHIERAGKRKAREEQHGARKTALRTNETMAPLGAHTPPGRGGGGGQCSGGQGRVQGRQHSGVSTARLPVSTRTLRGCLIGEGQLNKEPIPPSS